MGMRILKIMVIVGGLLVVAGSALLLKQIYGEDPGTGEKPPKGDSVETSITIPIGAEIISATPVGAGVAVLVKLPSGGGQLLMVNQKGKLRRRVVLEQAP